MMYGAALYFPVEARRYAASLTYGPADWSRRAPRAIYVAEETGCCPVGNMLRWFGVEVTPSPPATEAADEMVALGLIRPADRIAASRALRSLMADNDAGRITDYFDALGVAPGEKG